MMTEGGVVALTEPVERDGTVFPAGSVGTVVHVYRGRAAFEVEFTAPFTCVITVRHDQLGEA